MVRRPAAFSSLESACITVVASKNSTNAQWCAVVQRATCNVQHVAAVERGSRESADGEVRCRMKWLW